MSTAPSLFTAGPSLFAARQPILDAARRVRGYEILYRQAAGAMSAAGTSADVATASVIDALFSIGFDTLTSGSRAFLNISRSLLVDGIPSVLPQDRVVLELGAGIGADEDVLRACRELTRAGYSLALDDFTPTERTAALVPLAAYVKVDVGQVSESVVAGLAALPHRPVVVAKHVETAAGFQIAVEGGADLFQGFFLGKPVLKAGQAVCQQHVAGLTLLQALHDPELTIAQLDSLVKRDAALCFLILRTVNSAAYALRTTVHTIREALVLLGRDTVRRWAAIWALAGLGRQTHSELLTMATVRARCCELLAASAPENHDPAEGFMVGLCSLLDAILERPLPELLDATPIAGNVRDALLGADNIARRTLDCVVAYEQGDWDRCLSLCATAHLNPAVLPKAYTEALRWSGELRQGASR
jgi:EAL and modified HD-GYP domain-containing signal transduction protein